MLEDLDTLAAKLNELAGRVRTMRAENHKLRTQLAAAGVELETLRARVSVATQRIDAILERLPADREPMQQRR